jgi:hypothetical protein
MGPGRRGSPVAVPCGSPGRARPRWGRDRPAAWAVRRTGPGPLGCPAVVEGCARRPLPRVLDRPRSRLAVDREPNGPGGAGPLVPLPGPGRHRRRSAQPHHRRRGRSTRQSAGQERSRPTAVGRGWAWGLRHPPATPPRAGPAGEAAAGVAAGPTDGLVGRGDLERPVVRGSWLVGRPLPTAQVAELKAQHVKDADHQEIHHVLDGLGLVVPGRYGWGDAGTGLG